MQSIVRSLGGIALALCGAAHAQGYYVQELPGFVGYDINNVGQVAGSFGQSAGIYQLGSGSFAALDLGLSRTGVPLINPRAIAINDAGEAAAMFTDQVRPPTSSVPTYSGAAFVGVDGSVTRYVTQYDSTSAYAMTEDGRVLGSAFDPGGQGFVTGAHGQGLVLGASIQGLVLTRVTSGYAFSLSDLNSWADLAGGATFSQIWDVNALGQVLARADNGSTYVLSPVPEPSTYALMLVGLAALGTIVRRRGIALKGAADRD